MKSTIVTMTMVISLRQKCDENNEEESDKICIVPDGEEPEGEEQERECDFSVSISERVD